MNCTQLLLTCAGLGILSPANPAALQTAYDLVPQDTATLPSLNVQDDEILVTGPAGLPAYLLIGPRIETRDLPRNIRLEVDAREFSPFRFDDAGGARFDVSAAARAAGFWAQVLVFDETNTVAVSWLAPRSLAQQSSGTPSPGDTANGRLGTGDRGVGTPCNKHCPGCMDLPDGNFNDTNCDGIDGDAARALFVDAEYGDPNGDGSQAAPIVDLQLAIDTASFTSGVDHVYVSTGLYAGPIYLAEGVSVWGGFDASDGWRRASDHLVVIHNINAVRGGVGVTAIQAAHLSSPITMGDIQVEAWGAGQAAIGDGSHVFGIHLWEVESLRLERVTVQAAFADRGMAGASGGTGSTSHTGGSGGRGGTLSNLPGSGKIGGGSLCGLGGLGGLGGAPYFDGFNGVVGIPGLPSTTLGKVSFGSISISGPNLLVSGNGTQGGDGCLGGAGGGGGGGGYAPFIGDGGKGGKGGRGGRAGLGGFGGKRGGSSVGVFLSSSHLTAIDCIFSANLGGWGGPGGAPGSGTGGSPGSKGQLVSGPDGGDGGHGGFGGIGMLGAPGAGGHCYGVLANATSTSLLVGTNLQATTPGIPQPFSLPVGHSGEAVPFKQL